MVGTPAKIMKYRFDESTISNLRQSDYYKYTPGRAKALLKELLKE